MTLLVLLASVTIGALWGTLAKAGRNENVNRITSLLRSVRAEAANRGRRFQLTFDEEARRPIVSVEDDPFGQPGVFTPYNAWWAERAQLQEGVRVVLCQRTGDSAFADGGEHVRGPGDGGRSDLSALNFHPDGASDSARIILADSDEDRPWAVEITLNGVDGSISTREIDTEEEPIE